VKKFVCASLSAALVSATVTPALAQQDFGFYDAYASREDAATAMLDYRIPLDGKKAGKANYGLSFKYGPAARPLRDADNWKPDVKLADLRFSDDGLQRAQVASWKFAGAEAAPIDDDRLNMTGDPMATTWIIVGLVAAGAIIWAISEDDDDDD
jgi:hypothetical protein